MLVNWQVTRIGNSTLPVGEARRLPQTPPEISNGLPPVVAVLLPGAGRVAMPTISNGVARQLYELRSCCLGCWACSAAGGLGVRGAAPHTPRWGGASPSPNPTRNIERPSASSSCSAPRVGSLPFTLIVALPSSECTCGNGYGPRIRRGLARLAEARSKLRGGQEGRCALLRGCRGQRRFCKTTTTP
jgi:hypothetical protein